MTNAVAAHRTTAHFKGLTEIRGIAALVVLFCHADQFQEIFGNEPMGLAATGIAGHAVTIFFVLSGFLITYLLRSELATNGTLSIRKFYVRRILRIWPVYYLALLAAVLLFLSGYTEAPGRPLASVALYTVMLPNVAYAALLSIRTISPLWSVGVEEQFYLIWPWIVRMRKDPVKSLLVIIVAYLILRIVVYIMDPTGGLYALVYLTRIDCMAIGGLLACFQAGQRTGILRILHHPICQTLAYAILVLPLVVPFELPANLELEVYALASGVLILNVATNPRTLLPLDFRPLRFFGLLSYGIYSYHLIVLFALRPLLQDAHPLVIHLAVFGSTTLMAYLSYHLMEQRALRYKDRFAVVKSRS
ncbi:MAG TPA: acyltransferase [Flavobacteriales bacterium]|nr:acyltransferase [Flavobacteriales bacterium]